MLLQGGWQIFHSISKYLTQTYKHTHVSQFLPSCQSAPLKKKTLPIVLNLDTNFDKMFINN